MKKRVLSFILACALVLSLGGAAFALDNPPAPSITIGSATAKAGDTLELPLTVSVASGYYWMSFQGHLTYPSGWSTGTMKAPDSGPIRAGMNKSDPEEGISIVNPMTYQRSTDMFLFGLWDDQDLQLTLTGDILVGYLRVTVPAGTADGEYEISLEDIQIGIGAISNPTDNASVTPNLTPGVITVTHTHVWDTANPEWTWEQAESGAWSCQLSFSCNVTGCTETQTVDATVTSTGTQPTCTEAGSLTYTAKATVGETEYTCPETKSATPAATGHKWAVDTAGWSWSDTTPPTATVALKCGVCSTTVNAEAVVTEKAGSTPATCDNEGSVTYVAVTNKTGAEYKNAEGDFFEAEKGPITTPASGHNYSIKTAEGNKQSLGAASNNGWTWTPSDDGKSYTATVAVTCSNEQDGSHDTQLPATVTSVSTSVCEQTGTTTYTARVYKDETHTELLFEGAEDTLVVTGGTTPHEWEVQSIDWTTYNETAHTVSAVVKCGRDGCPTNGAEQTVTANVAVENQNPATCAAEGSEDRVVSGTERGTNYSKTVTGYTLNKLGHIWALDTTAADTNGTGWKFGENKTATAYFKCTREGCNEVQDKAATIGEGDENVVSPAKCMDDGESKIVFTATPDDKTGSDTVAPFRSSEQTVTVGALGHDYADPADTDWTWAEGNASASVTLTCQREGCTAETTDHTKALTDNAPKSEVTTEPACETAGVRTYTATVKVNESDTKSYTGTKTEEIPANGHTWGDPTDADWSFDDVAKTATLTFTCTTCSKTQTVDATKTGEEETDIVSCLTDGNLRLTFSAVVDEGKDNEKKVEGKIHDILETATGHELEAHPLVPATCDEDGVKAYCTCKNGCGMIFADSSATTAADNLADTFDTWKVIEANKHSTLEVYAHVNATFENDGNYAYAYCPVCEKFFLLTDSENPAEASSSIVYYADADAIKGHTGIVGIDAKGDAYETNFAQYIRIPMKTVLYGDVNGDGFVDSMDYSKLKQYLLRMITEDKINMANADCNGDGKVDSMDYSKLKQYLLRMITKLGPTT